MSNLCSIAFTEDGFAFNVTTGESYTLNRCGQLVMQQIKQGQNRQQIASFLCQEFGIPNTQAERDVADFFGQLNALGLMGGNQ